MKRQLLALLIIIIAAFIVNLGFSALSPVFPYLILAIKGVLNRLPELTKGTIAAHKGAVELGLLTAAFMITRAPTAGVVGVISDTLGKKNTIIIGMFIYFLSSIGFLLSNDILLFIVFRATQGIASAMVWPIAEAYLADITPRWSRGKVISIYTSSTLAAEILGPTIGVIIYKLYIRIFSSRNVIMALKSPIAFLAFTCLLSAITLFFLPNSEKGLTKERQRFSAVIREIKSMPRSIAVSIETIYVNGFINGFAVGMLNTVAIVYIIEIITKDPTYLAIFFSIFSLVALPAALLGGYISDKMRERKLLIIIGYIVGRSSLFFIPLIRDYVLLIIVGSFLSLVFGFSSPIMRALQADLAPDKIRGSIFGFQQLFFNTGIFIGSIIGGYLTENYAELEIKIAQYIFSGYIIPFWIAGILGLITTLLFTLYVREK